jgi:hypothetical protein
MVHLCLEESKSFGGPRSGCKGVGKPGIGMLVDLGVLDTGTCADPVQERRQQRRLDQSAVACCPFSS